ncbi:dipeptidyl peptidase 3 [Gadus morhua]|uniref:dipeptidyl peptidase 3 n=1 Tax=Gadus morhua TaxID=8049 RepID=UPI0011B75275|nr:dipeptidyl peptidase 3-like [Gadus morhua]
MSKNARAIFWSQSGPSSLVWPIQLSFIKCIRGRSSHPDLRRRSQDSQDESVCVADLGLVWCAKELQDRPSWYMQPVFMQTWETTNLLETPSSSRTYQSQSFKEQPGEMEALCDSCSSALFSLEDKQKQLGLGSKGITTYFSGNCVLEDAELAQKFLDSQAHAASENQKKMLEGYRRSFTFGSIAHKEGSRFWIKDKGPTVESYIGFIESYRDPFGSRGEFEGFVAVVNKAMSERFAKLVSSAEVLLPELPWPRDFEKDTFLKPDFTSLDVLTFTGSGVPAGINIPNYDDIRQSEGFKNVSLGNVLAVAYVTQKEKLTFLEEDDKDAYIKWMLPSFEMQGGLHELLGHGSGKLFVQDDQGKFNFDQNTLINPVTGEKVTSWYRGNETWDSRFSTIASSYEECRAECVGLYLCLNKLALSIFGHEGQDAEDVVYINWLYMVRAGLLGLEFYTSESSSWRQVGDGHHLLYRHEDQLMFTHAYSGFIMCPLLLGGEAVELVEYEGSAAGLIHSFTERFQEDAEQLEADLLELSKRDSPCWCH